MKLANSVEEFLTNVFIDKYLFDDLYFNDLKLWDELFQYCINNYQKDYNLCHILALCCNYGKGTNKDSSLVFKYSKIGAENFSSYCMYDLGFCYEFAIGVDKDISKTLFYYEEAAKMDNPSSNYRLGNIYYYGTKVEKNLSKAFYHYLKAANLKHRKAYNNVGICFEYGEGTNKDLKLAFSFYQKGAEFDDMYACYNLAKCYKNGIGTQVNEQLALEWYKKAANLGHADSQVYVGNQYYNSNKEGNYEIAFSYYEKASKKDHKEGLYCLGLCYFNGNGTTKNFNMAFESLSKASSLGHIPSKIILIRMYASGLGILKDEVKAKEIFDSLKEKYPNSLYKKIYDWTKKFDNRLIDYLYGLCLLHGYGCDKDVNKAYSEINHASEEGLIFAQLDNSYLLEMGIGVEKDILKAKYWYIKAFENILKSNLSIACNIEINNEDNNSLLGLKLFLNGKKSEGLSILSNFSDVESKYLLGLVHYYGYGIDKNEVIGISLIKESNYSSAYYFLAELEYFNKNYQESYNYLLKCEEEDAEANILRGVFYELGFIEKCEEKAEEFYLKAYNNHYFKNVDILIDYADRGYRVASYILGLSYDKGFGINKNFDSAVNYLKQSANKDYINAMFDLGYLYDFKEIFGYNYTNDAIIWYTKAAELGDVRAMNNLGVIYSDPVWSHKDYTKAFYWYSKAMESNDLQAITNLSEMYRKGQGVKKSIKKAIELLEKAAENNYISAIQEIGLMYINGLGVDQDIEKAIYFYQKGANLNDPISITNLGVCYQRKREFTKALDYYFKAAELNEYQAMNNIGTFYYKGIGVKENVDEAIKWYLKAEGHNFNARYNLALLYYYGIGVSKDLNIALNYAKNAYFYGIGMNSSKQLIDLIEEDLKQIKDDKIICYGSLKLEKRKDVFISWNHLDKNIKDDLVNKLNELGINSCFDSDANCHGELVDSIKNAINESKALVVLVTKNSIHSEWVKQEVNQMLEKIIINPDLKDSLKPILISDEEDIVKLINQMEDKDNPFKELLKYGCQFENRENGININNIKSFIDQTMDKSIKLEYKNKVVSNFDKFTAAIKNHFESSILKTGELSAVLDFEEGYIERNVSCQEKDYSISQILDDEVCLIYGEGGCGKSLYLKNLVRKAFKGTRYIFYLECKNLFSELNEKTNFLSLIKEKAFDIFNSEYHQLSLESFEDIFINNNEKYVLIDALDEMSEKQKQFLLNSIKQLNEKYDKVHFIFTSRNYNDVLLIEKNIGKKCKGYLLKGLDENEIEVLFDKIYSKYQIDDRYKIFKSYRDFKMKLNELDDDIKSNPLLVSNLIYIYLLSNDFPNTQYKLIDKTISIMLESVNEDKGLFFKYDEFLNIDNLTILLSELAYARAVGDNDLTINIFKEVIERLDDSINSKDASKEIYNYLKNRGIINENNLSHQIFNDYFTALSLYNDIFKVEKIRKRRTLLFQDDGYELLVDSCADFKNENNPWPSVSTNFITKLDHSLYVLNGDENNEAFNMTLNLLLKEKNFSSNALYLLGQLIKKNSLNFTNYICEKMN